MILEGLVTTLSAAGLCNVAPMGAVVNREQTAFTLRPFQTATTFQNLSATRCAVFHVIDDVLLLARSALIPQFPVPPTQPAQFIDGRVLVDCCRWFELEVTSLGSDQPRSEIELTVKGTGERRAVWGFNRAQHAVLEATILATRVHLLPASEIEQALALWQPLVEKTGGDREQAAWQFVCDTIAAAQFKANASIKS